MSTSAKRRTAEDLIRMPEDRGRFELIEGELHPMMSPSGAAHGVLATAVGSHLMTQTRALGLGFVMSSGVGFLLARDPDTVLAPDVSFVRSERLTGGIPEAYFEGAPDLAVEVVSKWDRQGELRDKARRFREHGASLVWIVDPKRRVVEVFSPLHDGHSFSADETLDAEPVLPGFTCAVREFFADLDRHEA